MKDCRIVSGSRLTDAEFRAIVSDSKSYARKLDRIDPNRPHDWAIIGAADRTAHRIFTICACGHSVTHQECISDTAGNYGSRECTYKCICGRYHHLSI